MNGIHIPVPDEPTEISGDSPDLKRIIDTVLAILPEAKGEGSEYIYLDRLDPRFNGSIDSTAHDAAGEIISDTPLTLSQIRITDDTNQQLPEDVIIAGVRQRFEIALTLEQLKTRLFSAAEAN